MSDRFSKSVILSVVIFLMIAAPARPASGAEFGVRPTAADIPVQLLSQVALHRSPVLDLTVLDREDGEREAAGLPYRFAKSDPVTINPQSSGTWEELGGGLALWRQRISCPGALTLNLGFTQYFLPQGSRLLVYPADGSGRVLAFDERDNKSHGQLWTPIFMTTELVVELVVDRLMKDGVVLELGSIGCGYREFGGAATEKSGSCNIDVVCPEGDPWRDEIDSVGVYSVNGTFMCTGTLMNNTAGDGRALFLTAEHCNVTDEHDATVVVYWNFQSPNCGDQSGGSLDDFQSGSTLLAAGLDSDFTLIELNDIPDPALGVKYAGWDRSDVDPTSAVCIHHPSTDEKSISFEDDPTYTTTYGRESVPGDGTHIMVEDWDLGTTEIGSSGSPLFNQDHRVVGQLHGGNAGCDNDEPDWYGRLSVSWDGGGTPETRLSDHLDPNGSGVLEFPPYVPGLVISGFDDWLPSGQFGGPFHPESREVTVANHSNFDCALGVSVSENWLDVSFDGNEIPAGHERIVTVALNNEAAKLQPGDHTVTLTFTETNGGADDDFDLVLRVGGKPNLQILSVGPNPFMDSVEIALTLDTSVVCGAKFLDLRGRLVSDLGEFQGIRGTNTVIWDGRGDSGRRLSAGVYVCLVKAGSEEALARVMLIH
ncbi:MAG: trypsin-like peptidase domain-containing protein [Gemmatimonadales bacterium]|nr:trypsin-like peptidase domain-containing protein [Gemmatimonadales bacterium]